MTWRIEDVLLLDVGGMPVCLTRDDARKLADILALKDPEKHAKRGIPLALPVGSAMLWLRPRGGSWDLEASAVGETGGWLGMLFQTEAAELAADIDKWLSGGNRYIFFRPSAGGIGGRRFLSAAGDTMRVGPGARKRTERNARPRG